MAHQPTSAADEIGGSSETSESLSQFIARVLDQLALSAWLPSAALVLSVAFIINLRSSDGALSDALAAVGGYTIADGLFLFVAVIVLTMATQAFEFEAIRLLEGYWGSRLLSELAADIACWYQMSRRRRLTERHEKWDRKAFKTAHFEISQLLVNSDKKPGVTKRDLEILLALRSGKTPTGMTKSEQLGALMAPWQAHAPGRLVRRSEHLLTELEYYPAGNRVMPTRLGNVLRSYEDRAFPDLQGERLAGAVQRVYHLLPERLRLQHDQFRTRLNLYCTMVFVVALVTIVATGLLGSIEDWENAMITIAGGALISRLCYRAAVASADGYGEVLLEIGKYPKPKHTDVPAES